jgi:hypothetical protein
MLKLIVSWTVLLAWLGCAGPSFTSRMVSSEPFWSVRLDTYLEPSKAAEVRHDHPADWSGSKLHAILSRLLLQEQVGLFDRKPPPRPVFSPEEIGQLVPALREAFLAARPSEWIVFYVARPAGSVLEITSGGLFLEDKQLHVIVANHRERVSPGPGGDDAVRASPIRSLRGAGGSLTFDPPAFVLASRANWLGGSAGPSASEVVLDHTAFLTAAISPGGLFRLSPAQGSDSDLVSLREQVSRLQAEIARLREKLDAQADELGRLKARQTQGEPPSPASPPKKPSK